MRRSLWILAMFAVACSAPDRATGPADRAPREIPGPGVLVDVDTRHGRVHAAGLTPRVDGRAGGPSFSLLDGQSVDIRVSNYSVSAVGAYVPGMVRVRFQIAVANQLANVSLLPPDLAPSLPAPGVLMLLPLLQEAQAGAASTYTGDDASVVVDRANVTLVRPSDEWEGGGALGSVGYDFARGVTCKPAAAGCSRWEAIPPLTPGSVSLPQTVGFDVAPGVDHFQVRLLLAANLSSADQTPPPPPPLPENVTGIPLGSFHLPASELGRPLSGAVRTVVLSETESTLDSATARGGRVMLAVARTPMRNADETFNLTYWKWEVDRYRSLSLEPYLANGTIQGLLLIDEPDCAPCWGGKAIPRDTVDEMARYAKAVWPGMVTFARVVPSWWPATGPRYLDAAWAQYEGPLHVPSAAQTPEEFRDAQVAAAAARGLGLVLGVNALDGGDGSSNIAGATSSPTRFQMTAAEYEHAMSVFAAEPYACAVINWRYSANYPALGMDSARLAALRGFDFRPEVIAANGRLRDLAAGRATAPCRRRS